MTARTDALARLLEDWEAVELDRKIAEMATATGATVWRGWFEPKPAGSYSYIADCRTFDVPETVAGCIKGAAPGMVAITLSRHGGAQMIIAAESAAAERGAVVIWWNDPTGLAAARAARREGE